MNKRTEFSIGVFLASAAILGIAIAGCGSGDDGRLENGTSDSDATTAGGAGSSPQEQAGSASQNRRPDEIYTDADGRQWIGKVPYDVFYDDPLGVIRDQSTAPVAVGASATVETPSTLMASNDTAAGSDPATGSDPGVTSPPVTAPPADSTTATAVPGESDWAMLISAEALDDEVKTLRNFLNEKLQSVGTYNSSMLMIPHRAATMATLAKIAEQHPGDVTWKDDAKFIAALAGEMNSETLQRGAKTQRKLLELFENVSDILNRSPPGGLPEPDPDGTISDVAEMRLVMMRMEQAVNQMKTEASTDTSFGEKGDMIKHESSILAAMTQAVTTSGYGYEDDEDFLGYAGKVRDAALQIRDAADTKDFVTFEAAMTTISQNCQTCHREYKNN